MTLQGTLYHCKYWSSSTCIQIMHELDVMDKFVIKKIKGFEGVKSAKFKAINPRQLVPYFQDDQGVYMGESIAIALRILDEYDVDHRLLAPPGETLRYKQLEASLFAVSALKPCVGALHNPGLSPETRTEQFHKLNDVFAEQIEFFFGAQDQGPFVFGADHGIADYMFCFELLGVKFADLSFNPELKDVKMRVLELPCVIRFIDAMLKLPSTQAVYPMGS